MTIKSAQASGRLRNHSTASRDARDNGLWARRTGQTGYARSLQSVPSVKSGSLLPTTALAVTLRTFRMTVGRAIGRGAKRVRVTIEHMLRAMSLGTAGTRLPAILVFPLRAMQGSAAVFTSHISLRDSTQKMSSPRMKRESAASRDVAARRRRWYDHAVDGTGHTVMALRHPSIGMGFNWRVDLWGAPGVVAHRCDDPVLATGAEMTARAIGDAEITDLRPALGNAQHPDAGREEPVWALVHGAAMV